MMRFAIVVSRFNEEVTEGLLAGARACLAENDVAPAAVEIHRAPGAFELPVIARKLARTGQFSGVICLGAVIKGETAHFELISLGATMGIQQAMLETGVPIAFGVLTTYTDAQAEARSRPAGPEASHNKGREAALACLETARTLAAIPGS